MLFSSLCVQNAEAINLLFQKNSPLQDLDERRYFQVFFTKQEECSVVLTWFRLESRAFTLFAADSVSCIGALLSLGVALEACCAAKAQIALNTISLYFTP